ncbi:enoyl-CoA hydratase-related protein [Bradyrhizobium liaoningense]|uniref:enoyl-CoA hydratase-related protein n=1 Tax=Bradyrhizobium liaoningense TaxID=43992 RepID=UPI001BAA1AE9|nr:enoyl-CoA hydratase-related protein [Bradyrhizobium liaoningense]MBR0858059.1 enoyl-CoA hydratase/isomerase family protein [Bradyrhizobium liaoningense]
MSSSKVTIAQHGNVSVIRLSDPETLNAVTARMLDELDAAIDSARASSRAIILASEGRAFSSGANLSDAAMAENEGLRDAGRLLETHVNPLIVKLKRLPIPWISAVRGPAVGVGSSIALAADLIIASETAYFLQAFSRIGLVPDGGAAWLLSRGVSRARAMELMLLGERLPAVKALEWGLVNRVVPDQMLDDTAMETAESLAKGPTTTLGLIRALSWAAVDSRLEDSLRAEREAQRTAGQSADAREGIAAFLEKRAPRFSGQ